MQQDRRQFISLVLLTLASAGQAGARPSVRDGGLSAAGRLGARLLAELPDARREALLRLAGRLWPGPGAEIRTALDHVAQDHAAGRTVPLGGFLLSETEASWLLRAAVRDRSA